jgi:hypothetical protein
LADKLKTSGQENLTLRSLIQYAVNKEKAQEVLDRFQDASQPFIKWRNKQVAHLDRATLIHPEAHTLSKIIKANVEVVLILAKKFLNIIALSYKDCELAFTIPFNTGGTDFLLDLIRIGYKYLDYDNMRQYQPDIPPPPF